MSIDGGEIQRAAEEEAFVRTLNCDFDPARRFLETNGVALMTPRGPDFMPQLKNMVDMSSMRFCSWNFAVMKPAIFTSTLP